MRKTIYARLLLFILLSAVITVLSAGTVFADNSNVIVNGGLEDFESSPDYSPNNWVVTKGWFVESNEANAKTGTGYLVAVQDANCFQTVNGIEKGYYELTAWINPAYNVVSVTITVESGDNSQTKTVTPADGAGYYTISNFAVTDSNVTVTLDYDAAEDFNSSCFVDDISLVKTGDIDSKINYVLNGGFEDMESSPDFSPNNWNVIKGWFVESNPSNAKSGLGYLVATQDAECSQTVSLENGYYDFSGWLNPAYNASSITVTLTSGNNQITVSVTPNDGAKTVLVEAFEVTDGTIVIKLEYDAVEDFNSSAFVDDLLLVESDYVPETEEPETEEPETTEPETTEPETKEPESNPVTGDGCTFGVICAIMLSVTVIILWRNECIKNV